ncbi:MAG: hypothetical protein RR749_10850 [Comamonas sp.]
MTDWKEMISKATEADLDGIVALQRANQMAQGGMLSAEIPRWRIAEMMHSMPLIVAKRDGHVRGFLMASTRAMMAELPVIAAMFSAYTAAADAYVYGPVCVDPAERGKGLAAAMFAQLRRLEPGREGGAFHPGRQRGIAAHTQAHGDAGGGAVQTRWRRVRCFLLHRLVWAVTAGGAKLPS